MPELIRVLVTRNWADVRAGLAVAHDSFVESGFQHPLPSGVRLLPSHLNPGTFVVLGLVGGRAAAAVTVTVDGPFGLPSDRAFVEEIDVLRARHDVLEVGSFGVQRWARGTAISLLAHLFSALYRVLRTLSHTTYIVGSFDAGSARFHGRTFGLLPVTPDLRPLYGAPATLLGASAEQIMATVDEPGGMRTEIRLLGEELSPAWLTINENAPGWPAREVAALLAESGALERMRTKDEIVAPILDAARNGSDAEIPIAPERSSLGSRRLGSEVRLEEAAVAQQDQAVTDEDG